MKFSQQNIIIGLIIAAIVVYIAYTKKWFSAKTDGAALEPPTPQALRGYTPPRNQSLLTTCEEPMVPDGSGGCRYRFQYPHKWPGYKRWSNAPLEP
jgi:hypothetical protein